MQSVSLYRTRIGARAIMPSRLEVLPVADLLDHAAHALVVVDGDDEIVDAHGGRCGALGGGVDLGGERPPENDGNIRSAHAAHQGEDLAVVDLGEQRAPGV